MGWHGLTLALISILLIRRPIVGHHHKSSSKPATQATVENKTTTSWIAPQTQQLINEAIAGAQAPADLQYIGTNDTENQALAQLKAGRDLALNDQINSVLSGEYQQNLANAKNLQGQGNTMGGKAQEALGNVQPLLNQAQGLYGKATPLLEKSEGLLSQVPDWVKRQGEATGSAADLIKQGKETTEQGQGIVNEAAEGQREIANATPEEMNEIINKFYNSQLVQDQIAQQRAETDNQISSFVQGLNQQAAMSGNMASSRAGVAQGVGVAKINSEFQKNLVGFQTTQYAAASQNSQNYIADRLSALNQLGQSGASIINAGGQYMQGANGMLGVASQYGNVSNTLVNASNQYNNIATGYQNAASGLSGLAGQFGQLGQSYGQLQNNYYNQSNNLNNLANTQMGQVFNNNLAIQDARVKDAANRFAAGQFEQQQAQQQAAINYQNQAVHANQSLAKLQQLLPMLNTVSGWQTNTVGNTSAQATAAQQTAASQLGGLAGAIGGVYIGNYLGGATGQQIGMGAGSYLGSAFL